MKCEHCGAIIEDGAKFCGECGKSIEIPVEDFDESDEKQRKGKGPLLLLLGVILAIVLGLAAGNALFDYLDSDDVSEEEPLGVDEENKDKDLDHGKDADTDKDKDKEQNKEISDNIDEMQDEEIQKDEEEKAPSVQEIPQVSVEDEVLRIRAEYNDITQKVSNGTYSEAVLSEGVLGYYNGSELKEILIYKGVDGSDYSRYYYFDYGQLMFAYYEGSDAHRFYFYQGALMRWRYSKSTANSQDAVNHDWENTSQFYEWEDIVERDVKKYY